MSQLIIEARNAALSTGLNVRRILPFRLKRMVGPFIFMDHAGPLDPAVPITGSLDVLPHPHIGLSTVSYLLGGSVTHRDSLGVEQVINPGEVNWMTAGRGIAHSERFEEADVFNSGLEMIQTWVALPEKDEEAAPAFDNYKPDQLPVYTDKGVWMRLIAGEAYGLKSAVHTHSPLFYLHVDLQPAATFTLPTGHEERAFYVVRGGVEINHINYGIGQMIVFGKNETPTIKSGTGATLMLLGGEALGDRFIWWNFVSSRADRIEQAKADWKAGRFILPPTDNHDFVPLPEDKSRPAPPPPELLS